MKRHISYAMTALLATIAVSNAAPPDKAAMEGKEKAAWQAFKDKNALLTSVGKGSIGGEVILPAKHRVVYPGHIRLTDVEIRVFPVTERITCGHRRPPSRC